MGFQVDHQLLSTEKTLSYSSIKIKNPSVSSLEKRWILGETSLPLCTYLLPSPSLSIPLLPTCPIHSLSPLTHQGFLANASAGRAREMGGEPSRWWDPDRSTCLFLRILWLPVDDDDWLFHAWSFVQMMPSDHYTNLPVEEWVRWPWSPTQPWSAAARYDQYFKK